MNTLVIINGRRMALRDAMCRVADDMLADDMPADDMPAAPRHRVLTLADVLARYATARALANK